MSVSPPSTDLATDLPPTPLASSMTQPGLFGQPDSRILPGTTNVPPHPSFADFRFTSIGQQPELLKRISAPQPDYDYHDLSSPEPFVDQDNSIHSTPKALSRPTLLESLAAQADSEHADMVVDKTSTETLFLSSPTRPRGLSHFSTAPLDPTRPPLGWSENTQASPKPFYSTPSSQLHSQEAPVSIPPVSHQGTAETFDNMDASSAQPADVTMIPVQTIMTPPTQEMASSANSSAVNPIATSTSPSTSPPPPHEHDSASTVLRALQTRLLSSLSSLKPPQMDTSHVLLFVQDANTQSAHALSTAHRVHTLTQQVLTMIHDAASLSQECISAAEQARAHASAAISALEQLGNPDSRYRLNNEWALAEAHDVVCGIGQWASEQEGEEAAQRREKERSEKERRHKELVDSAMRIISPQIACVMSGEVGQRAAAADTQPQSSRASVQTHGLDGSRSSVASQAAAEMEADTARRAWSLEHRSSTKSNHPTTSALPAVDDQRETEEDKRLALIAKQVKLKEELLKQQEQGQQKTREDEAEYRRMQDLNRQKLEVAQFHIKERERQERLQREEAARRAAEEDKLQKEAELLEEPRRKAEAIKAAELRARNEKARADKQARLEKQKLEEAAKEQERREAAARLEQKRAEEAAEQRAREEEAKKAAEAKAAEEAAKAALAKAYEEAQALEQQHRQEIEEARKKTEQEAEEASARARAKVRARELELQEAEEKRLREEQEKRRQEIMVNKQRATAETAAKILAERAQKEKEKNGGASTTPKSISPPVPASNGRAPSSCSQSPLTHPLPLPVHHSPTAHIGNLTAKMTVAPQTGDTPKGRGRALSGGVRLGTTDELSPSQRSQPESLTEPVPSPSSTLARSAALGLREKVPPIPKRSIRSNAQIAGQSQVESNIPPAKRLSKTQPSAAKPPSQVPLDMSIVSTSDIASPAPTTPRRQSAQLAATDECNESTSTIPVLQKLAIPGGEEEPPNNNRQHVLDPVPEPASLYRRGQDTGNLHVIPKSEAPHASPQAQAANLRFVKDDGRILWNTYLKPDHGTEVKSEPHGGDDDLDISNLPIKKGSGSTSPVIPKGSLEKDRSVASAGLDSLAMPSPAIALPTPIAPSTTACKPNLAALHISAPKPRAPKRTASNSKSSPAVSTLNTPTPTPTAPQKPKLPNFKKHKSNKANKAPSNTSATNSQFGPNSASNEFQTSVQPPQPRMMSGSSAPFESQTHNNNPSLSFDDSSAIAPVIQGDGGWDTYNGTPPGLSGSGSFDRGPAGFSSTRLDVEPGRPPTLRRHRSDHYSPPPSRQPPPNFHRHPQDQRSFSGPRPARPSNQIKSPRDRTPIPWTPSPPAEHSSVLGKRRNRDDDGLQSQPIRRQRQSDPQLERDEQMHRPGSTRTPPQRRPPTPDRTAVLQSRIGQREVGYGGDSYRPVYTPPDYYALPVQSRGYDSYPPPAVNAAYGPQLGSSDHVVVSHRDRHNNLGRHQVNETRPDLLDRMGAGSNNSNHPSSNRGRPANTANGSSRGRKGRGGGANGARPLEQRLSTTYNNNPLPLAHRLESPPRR